MTTVLTEHHRPTPYYSLPHCCPMIAATPTWWDKASPASSLNKGIRTAKPSVFHWFLLHDWTSMQGSWGTTVEGITYTGNCINSDPRICITPQFWPKGYTMNKTRTVSPHMREQLMLCRVLLNRSSKPASLASWTPCTVLILLVLWCLPVPSCIRLSALAIMESPRH